MKYRINSHTLSEVTAYGVLFISGCLTWFGFSKIEYYSQDIINTIFIGFIISVTILGAAKRYDQYKFKKDKAFYLLCLEILEEVENEKRNNEFVTEQTKYNISRSKSNFKKKRKQEGFYEKYKDVFEEHLNDTESYSDYDRLYNDIKNKYLEKLKENNNEKFDTKVERERLYSKSKKNASVSRNIIIGLGTVFITIIVNLFISLFVESMTQLGSTLKALLLYCLILIAFLRILKELENDKNQEALYNICLRVLEDIEKEMEDNNRIDSQKSENSKVQEMIAATIQSNEKESFIRKMFQKL